MSDNDKTIQTITDSEKKLKSTIKRLMFDIMTALFVLGMFFLEFGSIIVNEQSWLAFLGGFGILFVGSILIDDNEYSKGSVHGYESEKYKKSFKFYQGVANGLSGDEENRLDEFCEEFTISEEARIKRVILRRVSFDYDKYVADGYMKKTRSEIKADTTLTKKEKSAIIKANNVSIKQLVKTELLSEGGEKIRSQTELGSTAGQLRLHARSYSVISRFLTAALFTYFTVGLAQNISLVAVGWFILKIVFILFRRVTAYYRGYYDITETVRTRLVRKTDILNQFRAWGVKKYPETFNAQPVSELSSELSD